MHLRRTGGFGGIELRSRLDTDDLPEADARWLEATVAALPATAAPATSSPAPSSPATSSPATAGTGAPDAMRYELTIQHGGELRTLQYTDVTMPAAVRPLVQRLIAAAGA